MKTTVAIRILGQTFTVRSEATAEEARQVAEFVNRQIEDLGRDRTVDSVQLAVMALLNVAGSNLRLQQQLRDSEQEVTAGLQRCLRRLEEGR